MALATKTYGIGQDEILSAILGGYPVSRVTWADGSSEVLEGFREVVATDLADMMQTYGFDGEFSVADMDWNEKNDWLRAYDSQHDSEHAK